MEKILFALCSFLILAHWAGCESVSNETAVDFPTDPESFELNIEKRSLPQWTSKCGLPLVFQCPARQYISLIQSGYSVLQKDRQWRLQCQSSHIVSPKCIWSGFVNNFNQKVTFSCPNQYILTGTIGIYSKLHQDRRWRYKCCSVNKLCYKQCCWTPYINAFKKPGALRLPSNSYLVAVASSWDTRFSDHLWKFQYCIQAKC